MAKRTCVADGCDKPHYSKGWCLAHYWRVRKHGSPDVVLKVGPKPKPERERFWAKVDKSGDCWMWMGSRTKNGYGSCHMEGERLAHRWAYKDLIGPIPDGLHIDHLCRVRTCVNPDHLEAVTQAVNNRRADQTAFRTAAREAIKRNNAARRAAALAQTHCKRGHEFTEQNTIWQKGRTRVCRACAYEAVKRYQERKRATAL